MYLQNYQFNIFNNYILLHDTLYALHLYKHLSSTFGYMPVRARTRDISVDKIIRHAFRSKKLLCFFEIGYIVKELTRAIEYQYIVILILSLKYVFKCKCYRTIYRRIQSYIIFFFFFFFFLYPINISHIFMDLFVYESRFTFLLCDRTGRNFFLILNTSK